MPTQEIPRTFFVSGGTIPLDAASYVERDADRILKDALLDGSYCYVLTSRQMGKSSLCVRTMARLADAGVRTAFIDITRIGGRNVSPEQWYAGLVGEVGRTLNLRRQMLAYWKEHDALGPMQRFFAAIRDVALEASDNTPLVVFIDEIDATRSLPFSTDEFFAGIRECYNRRVHETEYRRLTFCLIGVAVPTDLISDPATTPFNVGERIVLRDFAQSEVMTLAAGLGQHGKGLIERIYYWTDGHPFLTQSLGRMVESAHALSPVEVDALVSANFFEAKARETNINLADVGNRVLNGASPTDELPKYRADILHLYQRVLQGKPVMDDESNRLISVLKLSGLVKVVDGKLRVRNRIYEQVFGPSWIRENMPGAEVRRQRAAFFSGAFRASAISTVIVAIVAGLAVAAVSQARRANQNMRLAQLNAERAQQSFEDATVSAANATRAEKAARKLLRERDQALAEAKLAASKEKQARTLADQRAAEALAATRLADANALEAKSAEALAKGHERDANLRAREAYVANLHIAADAIQGGRFDVAHDLLSTLRTYPGRGVEYDYAMRSLMLKDRAFTGHQGEVMGVGFSPDGRILMSGSLDGTVRMYDAGTSHPLGNPLPAQTRGVWSFAVAPVGTLMATGGRDGTLWVYDWRARRLLWKSKPIGQYVTWVSFSGDGKLVSGSAQGGKFAIWNAKDGSGVRNYQVGKAELAAVALSPDGKLAAAASNDKSAYIVDIASGDVRQTLKGHKQGLQGVAFSSDGRKVGTCGNDRTGRIWDVGTGKELQLLSAHGGVVYTIANSPDGKRWVTASTDGLARVWSDDNGVLIDLIRGHGAEVMSAIFSPDGDSIATASRDQTARIWGTSSSPGARVLTRFGSAVTDVSISADGKLIAAASDQGVVRLINPAQPHVKQDFFVGSPMQSISLSPDGRRVAVAVQNELVTRVYDTKSLRELYQVPGYFVARFSPDGRYLASDDQLSMVLYQASSGKRIRRMVGHLAGIIEATFFDGGKRLATSSYDSTVRIWDTTSGRLVRTLPEPGWVFGLGVSPDGKTLGAGTNTGSADLWDLTSDRTSPTIHLEGPMRMVEGFVFSKDGSRVLVHGDRRGTRIYDTKDGTEFVNLDGSALSIRRMVRGPNGQVVFGDISGLVCEIDPVTATEYQQIENRERADELKRLERRRKADEQLARSAEELKARQRTAPLVDMTLRAMYARNWREAARQAGALAAKSGNSDNGLQFLCQAHANLGDWKAAMKDAQALVQRTSGLQAVERSTLAVLALAAGEDELYRKACADLSNAFAISGIDSETTAILIAGVLGQNPSFDPTFLTPIVEPDRRSGMDNEVWNFVSAMGMYRCGRYRDALERLGPLANDESAQPIGSNERMILKSSPMYLAAMCNQASGNTLSAVMLLAKADRAFDEAMAEARRPQTAPVDPMFLAAWKVVRDEAHRSVTGR